MKTIAAIATGLTPSGIGIVRISGPESYEVIRRIFVPAGGMKRQKSKGEAAAAATESWKPNRIRYGYIFSHETMIDEVLVMNMKAPHSYTGEDTIEINCHGGPLMMRRILQAVLACGADVRPAEPGEFTKRAFLNGRIDLSQAESVIDLINASNENSQKAALSQLRGSVSEAVKALRGRILLQAASIEAALDDPEHYVLDGENREALRRETGDVLREITGLIKTYRYGRIIKEGINTCILGKPNAGKSSLLNALLGEERAIVTEVPGTTRDIITESIAAGNLTLNIMDTAGIRDTGDPVESIGVKKAYETAGKSDLCLYVIDSAAGVDEKDREILDFIRENGLKTIYVINKADIGDVRAAEAAVANAVAAAQGITGDAPPVSRVRRAAAAADAIGKGNISGEWKAYGVPDAERSISDTVEKRNGAAPGTAENTASAIPEKEAGTATSMADTGAGSETSMADTGAGSEASISGREAGTANPEPVTAAVSARTGAGIRELLDRICGLFDEGILSMNDQTVITNERHLGHLKEAGDALRRVLISIGQDMPEDFYTIDLMDAYHSLGLIIGEETEDDLCDRIFSGFCMGK